MADAVPQDRKSTLDSKFHGPFPYTENKASSTATLDSTRVSLGLSPLQAVLE